MQESSIIAYPTVSIEWSLPTGDVVKPRPVSVAVELLEPGLLVRQRTAHLVVADFAQPCQPLLGEPLRVALARGPRPQPHLAPPHAIGCLPSGISSQPINSSCRHAPPAGRVRVGEQLGE